MRFRNHFLILILFNTTLCQCFKGCDIFQRACRVCSRVLTFTPKKGNEILLKRVFLPTDIFSSIRFCHFSMVFKMLYMVKLSDNTFTVKQQQKSLECHLQMSLLSVQTAVSFELLVQQISFFNFNFSVVNSGTSRHTSFSKLYYLSLNTGIDCIPCISFYMGSILLILISNMQRK